MYQIVLRLDGKFEGYCRIQDGVETFVADTLEAAIKDMKSHAKWLNHDKITKKDITFRKQELATVIKLVPM